jgi:hypothetical protein
MQHKGYILENGRMQGKLFHKLVGERPRGSGFGNIIHLFIPGLFRTIPAHVEHLIILF